MIARLRGAALLSLTVLCGCVGPMGQREAQTRATRSLRSFCQDAACGSWKLVKTQKVKSRWLVDFESPSRLYTVAVDQTGATNVSVWDKNPTPR